MSYQRPNSTGVQGSLASLQIANSNEVGSPPLYPGGSNTPSELTTLQNTRPGGVQESLLHSLQSSDGVHGQSSFWGSHPQPQQSPLGPVSVPSQSPTPSTASRDSSTGYPSHGGGNHGGDSSSSGGYQTPQILHPDEMNSDDELDSSFQSGGHPSSTSDRTDSASPAKVKKKGKDVPTLNFFVHKERWWENLCICLCIETMQQISGKLQILR